MRPVIFHVDVNSAYLSWEAVYRLKQPGSSEDLREIASAVGGDMAKRRGIILAKSPLAKKCGVYTSQTIVEALRCCPELTIVPPNHQLYRQCSQAFLAILRQYSPCVEQYSIDEAFVDMTGTRRLFGEPREAAERIREHIYRELGFTVNIGVSVNRVLAKMASDFEKPNRVHTLFPEELEEKLWPLPLRSLLFVGKATEKAHLTGLSHHWRYCAGGYRIFAHTFKKTGRDDTGLRQGQDVSLVHSEPGSQQGLWEFYHHRV